MLNKVTAIITHKSSILNVGGHLRKLVTSQKYTILSSILTQILVMYSNFPSKFGPDKQVYWFLKRPYLSQSEADLKLNTQLFLKNCQYVSISITAKNKTLHTLYWIVWYKSSTFVMALERFWNTVLPLTLQSQSREN